jgi:hypothetical protein
MKPYYIRRDQLNMPPADVTVLSKYGEHTDDEGTHEKLARKKYARYFCGGGQKN